MLNGRQNAADELVARFAGYPGWNLTRREGWEGGCCLEIVVLAAGLAGGYGGEGGVALVIEEVWVCWVLDR